jgi:hypothetical protein
MPWQPERERFARSTRLSHPSRGSLTNGRWSLPDGYGTMVESFEPPSPRYPRSAPWRSVIRSVTRLTGRKPRASGQPPLRPVGDRPFPMGKNDAYHEPPWRLLTSEAPRGRRPPSPESSEPPKNNEEALLLLRRADPAGDDLLSVLHARTPPDRRRAWLQGGLVGSWRRRTDSCHTRPWSCS